MSLTNFKINGIDYLYILQTRTFNISGYNSTGTTSDGYNYYIITSNTTIQITNGFGKKFYYVAIGGGGSGGAGANATNSGGAGGNAGNLQSGYLNTLINNSIICTIGAGGGGVSSGNGNPGGQTIISFSDQTYNTNITISGGAGGAKGAGGIAGSGGSGTDPSGNSVAGVIISSGGRGGNGGNGFASYKFYGYPLTACGGGGGGNTASSTVSIGGIGGGGNGGINGQPATPGTNYGSGGGGGYQTGNGIAGSSGLIMLFCLPSLPYDIPGCCLWLDASDPTSFSYMNNKVSQWRDKSSNAFVFNQITDGNRPVNTNTQNGLKTITFDATRSTYLLGPSNFSIGTSSYSLFVVCNITLQNNETCGIFNKSMYGAQAGRIIMAQSGVGTIGIQYTHTDNSILSETSSTYTVGNYRILELIVNRGEGVDYAYQNGNYLTSMNVSDSTNYADNSDVMLIGTYNDGTGIGIQPGYYLSGNIAEIVSYKGSDMTNKKREIIEGYLAWKWGIQSYLPLEHSYRNVAP